MTAVMTEKPTRKRRKRGALSDEHKAKLAEGRDLARAVDAYLEAITAAPRKRGRQRTIETTQKRLEAVKAALQSNNNKAIKRLELLQERRDLEVELVRFSARSEGRDIKALEREFVKAAKRYGERRGISYGTWRECSVPPDVLKAAGITRG